MSLVQGLGHIGIRVHELAAARAFYELLGFEFVAGPVGPEPVAILIHPSGVEINLIINAHPESRENVLMDIDQKHAGYTHIALVVRDLAEARSHLERAGHALSGGPVTFPNGVRAIFFRDPDRNVIELDELPSPRGGARRPRQKRAANAVP